MSTVIRPNRESFWQNMQRAARKFLLRALSWTYILRKWENFKENSFTHSTTKDSHNSETNNGNTYKTFSFSFTDDEGKKFLCENEKKKKNKGGNLEKIIWKKLKRPVQRTLLLIGIFKKNLKKPFLKKIIKKSLFKKAYLKNIFVCLLVAKG